MFDAMLFFSSFKTCLNGHICKDNKKMWLFPSGGIKLVGNINFLCGYFVQIDFSFGLTLFANEDFSSSCLKETISFVESNYTLLEKSMGGF